MSLPRFRYFEAVARLGTIREAAEVLHVAPSAISRQIANLEKEFDVELFERKRRGLSLTDGGQVLLHFAKGVLHDIEHARSAIDDLKGLRRGHVRVWSVEGMVDDFVAPALAAFWRRHPGVTVDLMVSSTDRVCAAIIEDEADIGVAFDPLLHSGIAVAAQIADPLHCIFHPAHPAAKKKNLSLSTVMQWPIAIPDRAFGVRRLVDAAARVSRLQLHPTLITNSIEALRSFPRSGVGVTILPRLGIVRDDAANLLIAVPFTDRILRSAQVKICVRRGRRLPVAAAEMMNTIIESARRIACK